MIEPEPPMPEPTPPRPLDLAGLSAAAVCCLLWGGNAVAVKFAISDAGLPPVGCAAIRFLISLPVVYLVCRGAGASLRVPRKYWWLLAAHGLLTAVQIGSYNWGTSRSEAGRSSVFINIHPLVVAPLAWLILGEHLGWRGIAGLVSAASGVAVMIAEPLMLGGGGLVGDLVVLASGVVFGLQAIAQKKTFPIVPPTTLLLAQSALAIPPCLAYSAIFEGSESYHFTRDAILGVIYQGLFVSGVAFAVWMILLKRHAAGRLAAVAFLTPFFGITLGAAMRGEPLTWPLLAGGALVGLGIYLVAGGKSMTAPKVSLCHPPGSTKLG